MDRIKWSSNFAYVVGLMATDGNLSKDGRHLDLTSKDMEQLENFQKCLGLNVKIGWKSSGYSEKKYPRVQFGDIKLYNILENIGLHPNKTKTIGSLKIPNRYFFDFLRGCFDGDGCTYSYWDPRWKSSFMIYLQFVTASKKHVIWLQRRILQLAKQQGKIKYSSGVFQLVFAKNATKKIIQQMYKNPNCVCLTRKKEKILAAFKEECRDGEIGKHATLRWWCP